MTIGSLGVQPAKPLAQRGETMDVRTAQPADLAALTTLWHDGWQDAHAALLPRALAQHRTLESFRARLHAAGANVRVVGPVGDPDGLCITRDDEVNQLYVAARARGKGVAAALLVDAETRLAAAGVTLAWLACAIGNTRAARFYEKHRWRRVGSAVIHLNTPEGSFPLEVWRYDKPLVAPS